MANRGNNGGVTLPMLQATGRDRGPDIVLNVEKGPFGTANAEVNGIITPDSSITEVLNIVAYLTIPTATRTLPLPPNPIDAPWFNKEHSVMNANGDVPGPSGPNGFYAANALAPLDNTLFVRGAATQMLYNLDTMAFEPAGAVAGGDVIPVCIRKRAAPAGAPLTIGQVADTAAGAGSDGNIPAAAAGNVLVNSLMSDCVKQMINILENTRTIFGPKGWTALFSKVKGGGGAKRTHRQHRRKYSSKHY